MVHGGSRFRVTALINADARAAIADLAPLHQPRVLADIDAMEALLPSVPAVACFDTAFHAGLSEAAATYALPMAFGRNVSACATMGFTDSPTATRRDARSGLSVVQPDGSAWCPATRELAARWRLFPSGRPVDTITGFTPLEGRRHARCPGHGGRR